MILSPSETTTWVAVYVVYQSERFKNSQALRSNQSPPRFLRTERKKKGRTWSSKLQEVQFLWGKKLLFLYEETSPWCVNGKIFWILFHLAYPIDAPRTTPRNLVSDLMIFAEIFLHKALCAVLSQAHDSGYVGLTKDRAAGKTAMLVQ